MPQYGEAVGEEELFQTEDSQVVPTFVPAPPRRQGELTGILHCGSGLARQEPPIHRSR